nr:septum formation family protein [Salsipaludibacter albus]
MGVSPDADPDELRAAHGRLVRLHHPDRHASASPEAQAAAARRTAEVNEAFQLLRDPHAMARQRARTHRAAGTGGSTDTRDPSPPTDREPSDRSDERPDVDRRRASASASTGSSQATTGRWDRTPPPPQPRPAPPSRPARPARQDRPPRRQRTRRSFGSGQAVGWMLVAAAVGAGLLLGTDTGRDLLDDLSGSGSAEPATVEQPPPAEPAGVEPGVVDPLDRGTGVTEASVLETGSCYDSTVADGATGSLDVTGVTERDCWEPHQNEALVVVQLDADRAVPYPGADTLMDYLAPTCERARERVLGPEPGPEWASATLYPSPDSWAAGDRQAVCEVSLEDGSLLEGPLAEPPEDPTG